MTPAGHESLKQDNLLSLTKRHREKNPGSLRDAQDVEDFLYYDLALTGTISSDVAPSNSGKEQVSMSAQPERPPTHNGYEPLLTEPEAAAFLNFTPRALQAWRTRGGGPKFVRISARAIRYRLRDLETWVEDRLRTSTSDPGGSAEGR